jgi:hypothetical protein
MLCQFVFFYSPSEVAKKQPSYFRYCAGTTANHHQHFLNSMVSTNLHCRRKQSCGYECAPSSWLQHSANYWLWTTLALKERKTVSPQYKWTDYTYCQTSSFSLILSKSQPSGCMYLTPAALPSGAGLTWRQTAGISLYQLRCSRSHWANCTVVN